MKPLQRRWHHFPAILRSGFWLKLITSSALYGYDNAERREVDSVDFIISHFHMNNSAEEAFNLPTYLRSARKLHTTPTCAHMQSCSHVPPRLARTQNQHITIDSCPSQSLTGLSSSLCLWCSIRFFRWSAGGDRGCVRDSIICQGCSLTGRLNLQDFDLHRVQPGGGRGPGVPYQKDRAAADLCVSGH